MKKISLSLTAIVFAINFSYAQNTFPSSGNVGVGTTTPAFSANAATFLAVNNPTVNGISEIGSGGNVTGTSTFVGTFSFLNTSLTAIDKRIAAIVGNTDGATNSGSIDFYTSNAGILGGSSKMHINRLGNVGIGTTSPNAHLQVYDGGTGAAYSELFSLQTSYGPSGQKALTWRDPANITGQIATYYDGSYTHMSFGHLYNSTAGGYQTSDLMTLTGYGNVGIGTTSPTAALQIVRSGADPGNDYASAQITTTGSGSIYGPILYLNGTSGASGRQWGIVSSGVLDVAATGAPGNFAVYDATAGASRLVINSIGNVAIGTTDPHGYKLAVNGDAIATSMTVKLYAAWPDYVFKPAYHLPTLNEVKTYIDQNHHLPDMPSAEQVAKDGLSLGEMNAKLLKKVEELTLYLIEKDKEIKEVKQSQQQEIDELKKQVSTLIKAKQ